MPQKQRTYMCIDMKSFYASAECAERGLNPFETNLVVADLSRGRNALCLAVTPKMKSLGVKNRCRLSDIPESIEYIAAPPRMQLYIEYAADIYAIYLDYFAPEDIHVYSIDESFIDATAYLGVYGLTPKQLAKKLMKHLAEKETLTDFYGLQQIIYAKNMLRGAFGTAEYEYSAADGRKTVTLNGIEIRTLRMTAEQYAAADFAVKYGAVDTAVYYTGSSDVIDASEAKYSVSKSVRPVSGGSIAVGDKVRVEIKLPKSGEMLTVSDYIPSGFRFSEYSWDESSEAWLADQEGQRVTICAFPDNTEARAVFYIRAVAPGNFTLNSAYVFDADGEWGFTERGTVSVK